MLNQHQIIGYLGRDPELRYAPNGDPVCNFSIATTEKWKDKVSGEAMEATEWHRISVFGRLAEVCGQYLKKGSLCYVSGKSKTRKWTDKDGIERYSTEVHAYEMKMLGGKDGEARDTAPAPHAPTPQRTAQAAPAPQRKPAAMRTSFDNMDDDLPF